MITQFEHRWGIDAITLARLEGVTPDCIHMRVSRFGTPFQRRTNLTKFEAKYGRTIGELADMLGLHPITLDQYERKYGTIYPKNIQEKYQHNKGKGADWRKNPKWQRLSKPTFFTLKDIL